jgi:hypothetical protein
MCLQVRYRTATVTERAPDGLFQHPACLARRPGEIAATVQEIPSITLAPAFKISDFSRLHGVAAGLHPW